jgi:hypothetical protein
MRLILSLLAASGCLHAAFEAQHWEFRRPIRIAKPAAISSIVIDTPEYRASLARLADLRILRDNVEVPYVLETLSGSQEQSELHPAVLNKSVEPGVGVQATLDLKSHPEHDRLIIASPRSNFRQRVRIETSDDNQDWAVARDDGFIFDFLQDGRHVEGLTIDYPVSTRRYVRVTIFGWDDIDALGSIRLDYWNETKAVRDALARPQTQIALDAKTQTTELSADIGFEGLPYDQAQLTIGPGLFYRYVEIETSADKRYWMPAGQGSLSRTTGYEHVMLSFGEQWNRYVRLRILNHDNPPLAIGGIALSACRRTLKFTSSEAGSYWIYAGNAEAQTPAYDLAQVLPAKAVAASATLGAIETNPAYRAPTPPPKPWSDRHPNVLYAILGAAVIGMGFVAIRFLLKTTGKATG